VKYGFEWAPGVVLLGTVLVLLIVPPFALIALGVVALAALAALVALAGAVLATPYLLAHLLRRRLAERLRSTEASGPGARVIAQAGMATQQSGVAALANPTTASGSQ
jgi:membrane protein implicated in regulation of membrane protease activity